MSRKGKLELLDGVSNEPGQGIFQYLITITSGTVTLSIRERGGTFQPMTDGVFSASSDGPIEMAAGREIKADMTGTATATLTYARRT